MYSVVLMAALSAGSANQEACCFSSNWAPGSICYNCPCGPSGRYYVGTGQGFRGAYVGYYGGCVGQSSTWFGSNGVYGTDIGSPYGVHPCKCGWYGGPGMDGIPYVSAPYINSTYTGIPLNTGDPISVIISPAAPIKSGDGKVEPLPTPKVTPKVDGDKNQAQVIIDVPVQATLYIDGNVMPTKAGKRLFMTPALLPGQTYFYDVKIVQVLDGKENVQTTRVILRPGDVVAATFAAPSRESVTVVVAKP